MDTKKVIVTLLILTVILSVLTVAFTLSKGGKTLFIDQRKGGDQANVGLHIEGGTPAVIAGVNDNANVGLYVSS